MQLMPPADAPDTMSITGIYGSEVERRGVSRRNQETFFFHRVPARITSMPRVPPRIVQHQRDPAAHRKPIAARLKLARS